MAAHRQAYSLDAMLRIGRRRKWQIVLPALAIAAAASWWIHGLPDRFRSYALLLVVPQRVAETFVRSTVPARGDYRLQAITQQILSRTELERIIHDFDLYAEQRQTDSMQDVVDSMRARDIEIRSVKGDAFSLAFRADSPDVAMRVVERLVSLFIVQNSLDRATLAEGTDHFLEAQLEDARRQLAEYEHTLAEYRRQHNGELPAQLEASVRGMANTETQLQLLGDSLNRDRDRQLGLERSLKDANLTQMLDARDAAPADPSKPGPHEQLERAEASLKELQSTLTEQHPDVVTMKQTIADLRRRAEEERQRRAESVEISRAEALRRNHLEELRAELSAVEQQIAQKATEEERLRGVLLNYQRRIESAPTREAELAVLTRDYDTLQQTYRGLLAKKQESQIAANLERQQVDAHFKVLDPPRLPEQPDAPNRKRLYLVGLIAALAVGVIAAAILERFDRRLRTPDAVREALDLPVLAAIPRVSPPFSTGRLAATLALVALTICACAAALSWRFMK